MMNWRTGSWSGKKIATAPPPRSEPTRAPAQGSIDAGADPGQASRKTHGNFRGFWTHSAFLKQHHQPLQAEVAPWPKGPRPKTPPPSISMHPASMLTLDQRSSTWKPKISRCFRKFADRRIGLYPWAKTDNWLLLSRSGKSERVPKPRKSKDFGTKPRRAGGDEAVKTAPADDFPTLFKPTTLISAKMELNRKELPKLFDQTKFLEQKHIKNYQYSEGLWL